MKENDFFFPSRGKNMHVTGVPVITAPQAVMVLGQRR